ncbi:MAG: hypothetical protein R3Y21_04315 [Mycoplasmatota bacterium]
MDFTLLIVGMDANAYYMARCYHELTNKKAYLIGKNPIWYTKYSKITNCKYYSDLWNEDCFLKTLTNFYNEHKNEKILLVTATENYIKLISKNEKLLKKMFYFNYPNNNLIDKIIDKELFYKEYENNEFISLPKTYYYDCNIDDEIKYKTFPLILKASDVVSYRRLSFDGKKKIYKIENYEELVKTISLIKENGYKSTLIIQEYIPGDDSCLFDCVIYSDKTNKVKRSALAQIGLQEHYYDLVGNAVVMINGYNEFNDTSKIVESVVKFANSINYSGFAEFDLKYDKRDKSYKVLEINARQGRSSYYIAKAGGNLIDILAKDLIFNEEIDYIHLDKTVLLSFVNKNIVKKYIVNKQYLKNVLKLWGNRVNPIDYKYDNQLIRKYYLYKTNQNYKKRYKNAYWKNK